MTMSPLHVHPCVKAECLRASYRRTFKRFLGGAVLARGGSLAVLNKVGVELIVYKPITNIAGSD